MEINLNNPNRLSGATGNPSQIQSEGALAANAPASAPITTPSIADAPALTISNRESTIEDLAQVEGDLPTSALDRNDALGQMIQAAFNFPAPPPPTVAE